MQFLKNIKYVSRRCSKYWNNEWLCTHDRITWPIAEKLMQESFPFFQYQKVLNKSIHKMSEVFDDFEKDGWEEITDERWVHHP